MLLASLRNHEDVVFLLETADFVPIDGADITLDDVSATVEHVKHYDTLSKELECRHHADL